MLQGRGNPPLRVTLWAIALAATLPALAVTFLLLRQGKDAGARTLATTSTGVAIFQQLAVHERALTVAALRLGALAGVPPEVMERTMRETAAGYPAFRRMWACDLSGQVVASWPSAQEGGGRETEDPSPARRQAMKAEPFSYVAVAGAAGSGERVELAQAVRDDKKQAVFYLAADMATVEIVDLLKKSQDAVPGLGLWLSSADGRVIFPAGGTLPASAWRGDAGYGLTLHVTFPGASGTLLPLIALGAILLAACLAAALVIKTSRPRP